MEIISASGELIHLTAFEESVERLDQLEIMPAAANRLIALTSRENADFTEVHQAISADPSLAARVLRVASSAIYSTRPVTNLRGALLRIGMRDLRRMVIATSMMGSGKMTPFYRALWAYSLKIAAVSESIAQIGGAKDLDDPFLCGLLHDYGAVVMSHIHGQPYRDIIVTPGGSSQPTIERTRYGYDHTDLGAMVAAKWRLFLALEYVMQLHHEPLVAEEIGLPDAIQTAVYVVSLARQCVIDPTESDAELVRTLSDKLRLSATERASGVARGLQRYAAGYSTLLA